MEQQVYQQRTPPEWTSHPADMDEVALRLKKLLEQQPQWKQMPPLNGHKRGQPKKTPAPVPRGRVREKRSFFTNPLYHILWALTRELDGLRTGGENGGDNSKVISLIL